ncbi:MAG: creatininase [Deltaproteobacteria bacterium HGW-Deltaproteobacteria-4]|nr:MAG: creatininase [Deltaproteobacteria bacterium HGW-Deltaproteobacteria-4]
MLIPEMTMTDFSAGLLRSRSVIVPFGSIEEHGSHLPLDTDTMQAWQVSLLAAQQRPVFVAAPIHYGVCRSTRQHPGTISISTTTLRALTIDICSSLYQHGLRNFILLTGHAGGTHTSTLIDAGEILLDTFPDLHIAVVTEYMLASRAGQGIIETEGDAHAGEIETSRILHSHPHLVQGRAPREFPAFPVGILTRDKQKYWPGGVIGDPGKATAAKGEKIEALVVAELCRLLDQLENSQ